MEPTVSIPTILKFTNYFLKEYFALSVELSKIICYNVTVQIKGEVAICRPTDVIYMTEH
jgi:hypothetical protein